MSSNEKEQPPALPLNRIEAFSDGVIAIIITILVLEFKVPHLDSTGDIGSELKSALIAELPKLLGYVISFLVLAVWWVAHHHLLDLLARADRGVLWLNTIFLMFLALIPFPTGLLGEYPDEPLSAVLYGVVCFFTGLSFLAMRGYVSRKTHLLKHPLTPSARRQALLKSSLSPILYAISVLVASKSPAAAIALFALIPIYYMLSNGLPHRRDAS